MRARVGPPLVLLLCGISSACTFDFDAFETARADAADTDGGPGPDALADVEPLVLDPDAGEEACLAQLAARPARARPDAGVDVSPTCKGDSGVCARVVQLVATGDHSCLRDDQGDVHCWGSNTHGQLGGPVSNARTAVPETPDFRGVLDVAVSFRKTCVVRSGGVAECVGDVFAPGAVAGLDGVSEVELGSTRACFVERGAALCGVSGQLTEVRLPSQTALTGVSGLAMAFRDTCGTVGPGLALVCWGNDVSGVLGTGEEPPLSSNEARLVGGCRRPLAEVRQLALGGAARPSADGGVAEAHACAVAEQVYCWGASTSGQAGVASGSVVSPTPMMGPELGPGAPAVVSLALGADTTCAVRADGKLYCWGDNTHRIVALSGRGGPAPVLRASDVAQVALGISHACLLTRSGRVRCWGLGSDGTTAQGNAGTRLDEPTDVVWRP